MRPMSVARVVAQYPVGWPAYFQQGPTTSVFREKGFPWGAKKSQTIRHRGQGLQQRGEIREHLQCKWRVHARSAIQQKRRCWSAALQEPSSKEAREFQQSSQAKPNFGHSFSTQQRKIRLCIWSVLCFGTVPNRRRYSPIWHLDRECSR